MIFKSLIRFGFVFAFFVPLVSGGQVADPGSIKNHCASSEEVMLYNLINEYRRIHNLPLIPFSRSLSYVARVHAMDISINRPDFGGCNPHSWSAKGKWKPCCYAHDKNREQCMTEKPKEITGYRYKAWEIVYYDGEKAKASDAFDLWKGIELTNDYLLNTGKWSKPWKALGVGFYGDYACIWFGEGVDAEKDFGPCISDSAQKVRQDSISVPADGMSPNAQNPAAAPRYYIITGSLNSRDKAEAEVKRLKDLGYVKARTLQSGYFYRISVDEFSDGQQAQNKLPEYQKLFEGAWVLRQAD